MEKYSKLELLKEIGKNVGVGKPLVCPICSEYNNKQPLSSFGDFENELFCPHCELHLEIKLIHNGYEKWEK